jgi:hypothetical protein
MNPYNSRLPFTAHRSLSFEYHEDGQKGLVQLAIHGLMKKLISVTMRFPV